MIRLLWIGMPRGHGPIHENDWYINDYAMDLADAELFTLSRKYDAVIYAQVADRSGMQRSMEGIRESSPRILTVGLQLQNAQLRERQFLDAGGDEYIAFPQSENEEVVRLRIERLISGCLIGEKFDLNALQIDPQRKTVIFEGEAVKLQENVFKVFYKILMKQPRIVSKEELLSSMHENPEYVTDAGIDYAISKIRESIDRRFNIKTINTLRNRGYGFVYGS